METLEDGYWSGPDSYQSSTSTQRAADAARDSQREEEQDLLHEGEWEEFWRTQTEDFD